MIHNLIGSEEANVTGFNPDSTPPLRKAVSRCAAASERNYLVRSSLITSPRNEADIRTQAHIFYH
jgi:hypothetical protein